MNIEISSKEEELKALQSAKEEDTPDRVGFKDLNWLLRISTVVGWLIFVGLVSLLILTFRLYSLGKLGV